MRKKQGTGIRKWKRRCIAAVLAAFSVLGAVQPMRVHAAEGDGASDQKTAEEILASMTTEDKITQMMMVAPRWYYDSEGEKHDVTVLTDELTQYLETHHFGGVLLFSQNTDSTEQTVRLIDSMQKANASGAAATQLLIGIDQEGGNVTRLNECVQGPGNMALAATGSEEDVTTIYSIIGSELEALGINVNFCPDADVNSNPANPIIGVRSFSDDVDVVSGYAKLSLSALQNADVIACPKHFPGHGDTDKDSHSGLPRIDKSYDEIRKMELLPFRACIDSGTEMIMTAHIQYPQIEEATYTSKKDTKEVFLPATLSETIISGILRGDMGYQGVVVTDALDMDAITEHFRPLDAMELAIRAGVDILLVPGDLSTTKGMTELSSNITSLAAKVDADATLAAKVDASVLRILKLKAGKDLLSAYDGSRTEDRVAVAKQVVSTRANHEKEWDITLRSLTMVKNENNTLPLVREGEKTVILTAYTDEPLPMNYAVEVLQEANKLPKGATYEIHCFQGLTAPENRQEVLGWIEGADNVVAISEMGSAAFLTGNSAGLLDDLLEKTHAQGGRFILMSVSLPYDVARFQKADAIMITYGARSMNMDPREDTEPMKRYGPNMAAGLYMMLQEDVKPVGKLPVNLPKLNAEGNGYSAEILYPRGTGLTYEKADPQPDPQPQPAPQPEKKYSYEWVDGKWYDKDGTQAYQPTGAWKTNKKGTWYQDTKGWYPRNQWQTIDGKKYYFGKDGYLEKNAYRKGKYLGADGAWDGKKAVSGWKQDGTGWWYALSDSTYLKNCWKLIDGKWYYFNSKGYAAQNEFVQGWWVRRDCAQTDTTRYSWHKTAKGWWFGVKNGWYARSASYTINGKQYRFDREGYCLNP